MSGLKFTTPAIYEKFIDGEFVIRKSLIPFTRIGVDHAGEQVNKLLKVSGGLEGIAKTVNARDRFLLTAPFIGEIVSQMEAAANVESNKRTRHYQLSPPFIHKFDWDIESLINMYKHYGVDFQIRSDDKRVHNIVTKKDLTSEAETHIISAEERGQIELEGYAMNRLGEKAK